jgi:asparagine synthase (glutamine-hydrolysing)
MCGIAGARGGGWKHAYQSLKLIQHRGPDGVAVVNTDEGFLAHARLAIVDVEAGRQPMAGPSSWLICNGEIYNHPELRERYAPTYPYRTQSDSEDILAAFDQHREEVNGYLEGMYAFAIADDNGIYLARDPLGIKPLYYGWDGGTLYFASEIKALQDVITDVQEFPPGHWYSSKRGFVPYYNTQDVLSRIPEANTTPADVRAALKRSVHSHLMSDVPLGVFLSGGLDSSIIAAIVAEELPNVHSFSVGMAGSEDLTNARAVAQYIGTTHHEHVYTTDEMIEALPEVIYYLESFDPALVRSAIANYFLARLARQYVTVILSGEGADELYSGYSRPPRHSIRNWWRSPMNCITAIYSASTA